MCSSCDKPIRLADGSSQLALGAPIRFARLRLSEHVLPPLRERADIRASYMLSNSRRLSESRSSSERASTSLGEEALREQYPANK